jgi:hypothetical protein
MTHLRIKAQIWKLAIDCTLIEMNNVQQGACFIKLHLSLFREDRHNKIQFQLMFKNIKFLISVQI